jgi:hypothetical protein
MTRRFGWGVRVLSGALWAMMISLLPACGGAPDSASTAGSICALRSQASQAVLGSSGPYAGREKALASAIRKASIPSSSAEDTADLTRLRSEAAAAIEAVARIDQGNADARDDATAEVERALAGIAQNEACGADGGSSAAPASSTPATPDGTGQSSMAGGAGPSTTTAAAAPVSSVPGASAVVAQPPTTTTLSLGSVGLEKTDRLEREQPLIQSLPKSTTHYKIDYRVESDRSLSLTITLFAVLNRADQLPQYRAQLVEYKAEALAWLGSKGVNPTDYKTTYLPPEAANL